MTTTIQVDEKTLLLLKKLKEELNAQSYDEAINKIAEEKSVKYAKKNSMAGSLKKYYKKGETLKDLLKELQDERRKSDRF